MYPLCLILTLNLPYDHSCTTSSTKYNHTTLIKPPTSIPKHNSTANHHPWPTPWSQLYDAIHERELYELLQSVQVEDDPEEVELQLQQQQVHVDKDKRKLPHQVN